METKPTSPRGRLTTRRAFTAGAAALFSTSLRGAAQSRLQIGTMDTVLNLSSNPDAVGAAKQLGLAALQVTLGRSKDGQSLPLEDRTLQKAYVASSEKHGIPIDSTYIDMLHVSCLKNDPRAGSWVQKGIEITKNLKAPILMTVFFGKCSVLNRSELDYVIGAFRDLVPAAERAGIILGFENTISGEDNRYAVDRIASNAFKIWYDVGNSTFNGFDVPKEIRMLGRERICQFHFKDKGYLGEGKVNFPEILAAIRDIGFEGYANLETTSPSGSVEADTKRNLAYLQGLMSQS